MARSAMAWHGGCGQGSPICLPDIVLGTHSPYVYVPSVLLAGLAGWLACNGGEAGDGVLELMFIRSQQMAVCCAYID